MNEVELFGKAVAFAAEKHGSQTRKDGTLYLYHPMGVASLVKKASLSFERRDGIVLLKS